MASDIVMPRLSDSIEEGTILRWMKSVGDEVQLGEELVEIETDKANMVYDADAGGTLIEIVAQEGETLPIGQVIARVGEPGEKPSGDRRVHASEPPPAAPPSSAAEPAASATPSASADQPSAAASPSSAPGAPSASPAQPSTTPAEAPQPPPAAPAPGGDGRVKASPLARRIRSEEHTSELQ